MIRRRDFLRRLAALFGMVFSGCLSESDKAGTIEEKNISIKELIPFKKSVKSQVYVVKTSDRSSGIKELLKFFNIESLSGKKVALKANYNSQDIFPASTHIDTLGIIVDSLKEKGAIIVLAERSGMGDTGRALEETGVLELAKNKGIEVVNLDEGSDWIRIKPQDSHWKKGFLFPRVFEDADVIVQTCCLKTHRYGGHFTMSLKNSVGMVAKYDPEDNYNYMSELHSSSYQRHMIAEINTAYEPELIIMDGIKGFSKGGPDTGTLIEPGIMIASRDRVALDAIGVAVLRIYGTTTDVSKGGIFEQEQLARAVELGLGASGPDEIEIIPVNTQAQDICSKILNEFEKTG